MDKKNNKVTTTSSSTADFLQYVEQLEGKAIAPEVPDDADMEGWKVLPDGTIVRGN